MIVINCQLVGLHERERCKLDTNLRWSGYFHNSPCMCVGIVYVQLKHCYQAPDSR